MAEPDGLSSLSDIRIDEGFVISTIPFSCISNIPTSFVEPNLFFTPLTILYEKYLSPSMYSTVSTICSKTLGPAIFPSLVTCPIIIVVIFLDLQIFIILAVISLTWLTLPGADDISSEYIVCIESIITNLGSNSFIFSSIISISVSPKNKISSLWIFNLSALNFICSADSSPETYKTFPSPFILSQTCKINVDFPIPGSPPTNTKEPLTSPPPNTLSSSAYPVEILCASSPT